VVAERQVRGIPSRTIGNRTRPTTARVTSASRSVTTRPRRTPPTTPAAAMALAIVSLVRGFQPWLVSCLDGLGDSIR
jgi:hypothetical protein